MVPQLHGILVPNSPPDALGLIASVYRPSHSPVADPAHLHRSGMEPIAPHIASRRGTAPASPHCPDALSPQQARSLDLASAPGSTALPTALSAPTEPRSTDAVPGLATAGPFPRTSARSPAVLLPAAVRYGCRLPTRPTGTECLSSRADSRGSPASVPLVVFPKGETGPLRGKGPWVKYR